MRINKLFHWLYFVLMSLPIFAIGSACLISTFNMSTKEESEIHYKYETNNVSSVSDLVQGRIYHLDLDFLSIPVNSHLCHASAIYNLETKSFYDVSPSNPDNYYIVYKRDDTSIRINNNGGELETIIYLLNNSILNCDIVLHDINDNSYYQYYSLCQNIPIDSVETHNVNAQDVFYNSLNNVASSPLFTWAQASFLGVPVSYLGGIFGLASNSVINILLCYWVAISIIWLMFDVLMFVPMLVHKSIDKARF